MDSGGAYELAVAEAMELSGVWYDKKKREEFIKKRTKEIMEKKHG